MLQPYQPSLFRRTSRSVSPLRRLGKRWSRVFTHTSASYLIYRYRYLATFTTIAMLSIVLELALTGQWLPQEWPWLPKACLAFVAGMLVSFVLNATLNFRVPRQFLWQTFCRFALVSTFSFVLNMLAVSAFQAALSGSYA